MANYTLTQQTIIDEIDYIVSNVSNESKYQTLFEGLCNIVDETNPETYQEFSDELWEKLDEYLLNNYRS